MFFIVSKILSFLLTPIIWIVAMLFWALLNQDRIKRRRLLLASLLTLLFFSNNFILDEFMRAWEVPAIPDSSLHQTYDAGIIMSGMLNYDQSFDRLQFNRRNDRLMQAIQLYRAGRIKKLFFTGGSGSLTHADKKESIMVKRFLLAIGIPEQDILIEATSNNTYENAAFSKNILDKEMPGGNFLLITTAVHMRRASACFHKKDIRVTPYSVDRYSGPRKYQFDHLLIPDAEALFNWNSLIHEWAGVLIYKAKGYL